jgi:hypothetical protein
LLLEDDEILDVDEDEDLPNEKFEEELYIGGEEEQEVDDNGQEEEEPIALRVKRRRTGY